MLLGVSFLHGIVMSSRVTDWVKYQLESGLPPLGRLRMNPVGFCLFVGF